MLKHQLKLIVLKKLEENSLSGYDLTKEIYNSTGSWKPSSGSMYPLLKELYSNKLVTVKTINRRKVYSITASGRKTLKETIESSHNIIDAMTKEFKVLEKICCVDEREHIGKMIKNIHGNNALFGNLSDEVDRLQRVILSLLAHKKFESREKDIKAILNDTIRKLKRIDVS
jgi:DNA-binding PadR family transcriptional regulator